MKEIWKGIERYEGYYEVSNLGRVWSNKTNKILKHHNDKRGYARLTLRKNNKSIGCLVHRLVAESFILNSLNYLEVNHKDENPIHNYVDNLEWCDHIYNNNYGTKIARKVIHTDYKTIAKMNSLPVKQISKDGKYEKTWTSANECKRILKYDNSSIAKCCRGESKTAYGYRWEYCG